jgi:outer membrane lipoprotein LolB
MTTTRSRLSLRPLAALLACVLAAGLSGCASTSAPRSSAAVAPYRQALDLSGRIAINYSKDGKNESLSGKFTWRQSAARTDVDLISPTGQTVAVISVTPTSATLKQSGKEPRSAADLDSLMRETLGWSLPVSGLSVWMQGYATDAAGKPFTASPANDSVVTRDGWKLDYISWQSDTAAVPQPKRIDVTRLVRGGDVDEMAIRIVIDPVTE